MGFLSKLISNMKKIYKVLNREGSEEFQKRISRKIASRTKA